jgi:cation diffusion facilitator CzcD-associated flavoprotein CzcO
MQPEDILVIGAGPAGLATSACLRREGLAQVGLEREGQIAGAWNRHYDNDTAHCRRGHGLQRRAEAAANSRAVFPYSTSAPSP